MSNVMRAVADTVIGDHRGSVVLGVGNTDMGYDWAAEVRMDKIAIHLGDHADGADITDAAQWVMSAWQDLIAREREAIK